MIRDRLKYILGVIIIAVPLLLISGCSASLYKLRSIDNNRDFYKGKEIVYSDGRDYSSNVSFEYQQSNHFVFYVEVNNLTDKPITFYPENIYCDQLNENKELINSPVPGRMFAINPEKQIDQLNSKLEDNENSHSLNTGLNATFALISVVAHLADDDNHHKLSSVSNDITNWSINQANNNADYNYTKGEINSKTEFWKHKVLRKTTLYKKDKTGGLVFVPFNEDAQFIKLVLPIGNIEQIYTFKKIEIK